MLFIATPLYEQKVSTPYLHGMLQLGGLLASHGLKMQYAFEQSTYIAINREKLVRQFMASDCAYFCFIDADMVFRAQDVMKLLAADLDIVSGWYRYRRPVPRDCPTHCFRDILGVPIEAGGIQECAFAPTGMLMVRRSVFERMYRSHEYLFDQGFRDTRWFQTFFGTTEDKVAQDFEGEDICFSRLWAGMGGKIHVDTSVKVGHLGEHEYKL